MYKKIIVVGYHEIACTLIEELINHGFIVSAVIPNPLREGQYSGWYRDVSDVAKSYGIPVWNVDSFKNNNDIVEKIKDLNIDVIFSGFSSLIFPKKLIESVNLGCFNFHNADLPKYRGRAAPLWALMNGEFEIAMTLHRIIPKIDAGAIIEKELILIDQWDDMKCIYQKCNFAQMRILRRFLPKLKYGNFTEVCQDSGFDKFPSNSWREPEDRMLNFSEPLKSILNKIRALTDPFPNALTTVNGNLVGVIKAEAIKIKGDYRSCGHHVGTVIGLDDVGIIIATQEGPLKIIEVDFNGRHILGRHLFELLRMKLMDKIGD